ncbi:MAG: XRE family transcriptional regulator [Chlorobi bacterium]|nr:XRE family transcriptional regulator [Chlorobiota bacterium]
MPRRRIQFSREFLIGTNLRALRIKHGYTLEHVAQVAGVSSSQIANVESGRRTLEGESLRRVLQLYDYSLAVFLTHIETLMGSAVAADDEVATPPPIPLIGRTAKQARVVLLHPTPSPDNPEHLLVVLPAETELWPAYIALPVLVRILVVSGSLLVETPHREYALEERQFLSIPPQKQHRFRNHTDSEACAYIWVETACL